MPFRLLNAPKGKDSEERDSPHGSEVVEGTPIAPNAGACNVKFAVKDREPKLEFEPSAECDMQKERIRELPRNTRKLIEKMSAPESS